ncbi:RTase [Trichonephila clavipes]|nr:RTase [Trichonephila clavipes]
MVLRRLTFHLHSHNLLPEVQYGFREGHNTTDQLLYFCQRIRDAHNRKPTNHTVAAFLDLSKAFDRVWNNFLVIKSVWYWRKSATLDLRFLQKQTYQSEV